MARIKIPRECKIAGQRLAIACDAAGIERLITSTKGGKKKMFGIGMPELIVILVIILIIFGAGKLPQIGEGLGRGIRNFKKGIKDKEEINTTSKKPEEISGEKDKL